MATVAVIGANGQLGCDLCDIFGAAGWEVVGVTHADLDVVDGDRVRAWVLGYRPAVVVNTAAFHNVEACEADPLRAFRVNAVGARNVAEACRQAESYLIHISTDYVFDGAKRTPYRETDLPLPLNVYGNTKLAGEYFVLSRQPMCAVVRTSGLYGMHPCRAKGCNFVELMLRLASEKSQVRVVDDEVLTPTFTRDLARQILRVAEKRSAMGVCHATSEGECSWFEFAAAVFELAGVEVLLQRAGPGEFPHKAPRPKYSVLENMRLSSLGLNVMRHWKEALQEYLAARSGRSDG
ncbi:MAG TPA: dTDP-4-dehydrorhamnose reductase [Kiritimatiellae bacterium]|nr:dTDP-4-dehydrorhamnose reductase [Kiritimatiellia bacterium]